MRVLSEEHKKKLSEANKGQIPWNKGKSKGWISMGYKRLRGRGKEIMEHHLNWCIANEFPIIPKGFVIHHRNMNKLDNRIENLVLLPRGFHDKLHHHIRRAI